MKKFECSPGTQLSEAAKQAVALADEHGEYVVMQFGDSKIGVWPGDQPEEIANIYRKETVA